MANHPDIDRILQANRYLVLGTVDSDGRPWVTPVFFAQLSQDSLCWVSSPDSRHSRNIETRATIAITVFDSSVAVGMAEAAYFDANAARATSAQLDAALQSMNSRLPHEKALSIEDLLPHGPLAVYRADLQHRYILVRGGDPEHGNTHDMRLET